MNITVRKAIADDAEDFTRIGFESWKSAYKNIITPEELAKKTSPEKYAERVQKTTEGILSGEYNYCIALDSDGDISCGFCMFGESRDEDMSGYAEVFAIYALEEYWDKGVGGKLMEYTLSELKRLGHTKALLWVFEQNARARRFYEKHGFVCDNAIKDYPEFARAKGIRYAKKVL